MTVSLTTPVTGGTQTGFTSPTYTIAADVAPSASGKQYAVTAKGGTQPSAVDVSSVSRPFTILFNKPAVLKVLQPVDPVTGQLRNVPNNTWTWLVRKGVTPLAGQASRIATGRVTLDIPAGSDLADPDNIRAMISLLIGALNQASSGLGDTLNTGIV